MIEEDELNFPIEVGMFVRTKYLDGLPENTGKVIELLELNTIKYVRILNSKSHIESHLLKLAQKI
jgi:hypothetical protein